jgi:hypothetical protein
MKILGKDKVRFYFLIRELLSRCCYPLKFGRCLAALALITNGKERRRSLASPEMTINGGGKSPLLQLHPKNFKSFLSSSKGPSIE